jgi:hypothetical protein
MTNGLIGYTGFVGSTLMKQASFDAVYRSTTISEIEGRSFDTLVCAGAPAQKWLANRDPSADLQKIDALIGYLASVTCKTLVLISTVDVFSNPLQVDERTVVSETGLAPYGRHRRKLERFVANRFPRNLIVRLPGLVGPGLRKNVIYDLLNGNNLSVIDSRGTFQFYPMVNLWHDIQTALHANLKLIHLTAEPISVAQVSAQGFGQPFENVLSGPAASYDMQTCHAELFATHGAYQYSARETLQAIRAYAQSEPLAAALAGKDAS